MYDAQTIKDEIAAAHTELTHVSEALRVLRKAEFQSDEDWSMVDSAVYLISEMLGKARYRLEVINSPWLQDREKAA